MSLYTPAYRYLPIPSIFLDVPAEPEQTFEAETRQGEAGEIWVRLRGELDTATVEQLDRSLRSAFTRADTVIVDLRPLSFIDGAGLGALVGAQARADARGKQLRLIRRGGQFDALIGATGLDELFEAAAADPAGGSRDDHVAAGTSAHMRCPRCGLTIELDAADSIETDCPRCLGNEGLAIPMRPVSD